MLNLSRRTVVLGAIAGSVAITVPVAVAQANGGSPANKAVAAGSTLEIIGANQTQEILSATFKTSKPTDLLMTASLECSILTALTTNNANPSADARSGVRAWLELDGKVVPITDTSTPPQDPAQSGNGDPATDGVNFCDREYQRTVTDQEDPADGIDEESDYIQTKSAHAFSWVRLNAGSGMHTLKLMAQFNNATSGANAQAEAIVGNRTLVIEPTKMANNAVIAENGTSNSGQ